MLTPCNSDSQYKHHGSSRMFLPFPEYLFRFAEGQKGGKRFFVQASPCLLEEEGLEWW